MASLRSLELARRVWGWEPHSDGQRDWLLCGTKVKVGACGRRWGKSESMGVDIALYALENPHTTQIVIAPTDDQTKIIMEEVSRRLHSVPGMSVEFTERKSPYHSIVFHDSAPGHKPTRILARTAGLTGKGLRGHSAHRVIVDEAAYVPDTVMDSVVTPLLADYNGELVMISTPSGRNHFWREFARGEDSADPRVASFRFPSVENPYLSKEYLMAEKDKKSERTYAIEYEAEFFDEEGSVFRGVNLAVDDRRNENEDLIKGSKCVMGVDLARVEDFTVIDVFDLSGRQIYHERFNKISWERQMQAIQVACQKYKPVEAWIDSTGVGDPIFEALRKQGLPVKGYQFTNATKEALIDNLAMKIESGAVRLMDISAQTNELVAYRYEMTPSRNVRMNAPDGMHDDCVIALALAAWGLASSKSGWGGVFSV